VNRLAELVSPSQNDLTSFAFPRRRFKGTCRVRTGVCLRELVDRFAAGRKYAGVHRRSDDLQGQLMFVGCLSTKPAEGKGF
jgi:hypothetical protein